jgi:hypothetical protein
LRIGGHNMPEKEVPMEDILIVEKRNELFHIKSKSHRFSPQTCAAEYNALLRQLVAHGMPQDEFGKAWTQLQKTGRTETEVSLPALP